VLAAVLAGVLTSPADVGADPDRLTHSLQAIRNGFLHNDGPALARVFASPGPVFVRAPPLERGGFLGPGSLKAFLSRLLAGRRTVAFDLAPLPTDSNVAAAVYAKGTWTYRSDASATLQVEALYFALRYAPEIAEWRIVELKTAGP
jgi:hypothetical protein